MSRDASWRRAWAHLLGPTPRLASPNRSWSGWSCYLAAVGLGLSLNACQQEELGQRAGELRVEPLPHAGQQVLDDPIGLDVGQVPLRGRATARFRLQNVGVVEVEVLEIATEDVSGGTVEPLPLPEGGRIGANDQSVLDVLLRPRAEGETLAATLRIRSNIGTGDPLTQTLQVRARGLFVGQPALEVCYDDTGQCYGVPTACVDTDGVCELPKLDLGNIGTGAAGSATVRLRNAPPADTCLPPRNVPECTPTCVVTFASNSAGANVGVGFADGTRGFDLAGSLALPLELGTVAPQCEGTSAVFRREVPLAVTFSGADTTAAVRDTLVLESSLAAAPTIHIPVRTNVREAPVAVASLRACNADNPPPSCSTADAIRPLGRVYFDGRDSTDPRAQGDSAAPLSSYDWRVVDAPGGVNPRLYDFQGQGTALSSMFVPLAGEYTVRLTVANELGIESAATEQSDITFQARPESRLHVQLSWDHPTNDQDLHLVNTELGDLVYNSDSDCFWRQCRPTCASEPTCEPVQWSNDQPPFEGPNPSLDYDAVDGLGPENINIAEPAPGRYTAYVHYYGLVNPNDDPTRVTLRVYVDGILKAEMRRTLRRNQLWRAAHIDWPATGGASVTPVEGGTDAPGRVQILDYVPYPTGYDFVGAQ